MPPLLLLVLLLCCAAAALFPLLARMCRRQQGLAGRCSDFAPPPANATPARSSWTARPPPSTSSSSFCLHLNQPPALPSSHAAPASSSWTARPPPSRSSSASPSRPTAAGCSTSPSPSRWVLLGPGAASALVSACMGWVLDVAVTFQVGARVAVCRAVIAQLAWGGLPGGGMAGRHASREPGCDPPLAAPPCVPTPLHRPLPRRTRKRRTAWWWAATTTSPRWAPAAAAAAAATHARPAAAAALDWVAPSARVCTPSLPSMFRLPGPGAGGHRAAHHRLPAEEEGAAPDRG